MSSVDFFDLILSIGQQFVLVTIIQNFETTNDGAHPTGTVFSFIKMTKINKIQSLRKKILSKKNEKSKKFYAKSINHN